MEWQEFVLASKSWWRRKFMLTVRAIRIEDKLDVLVTFDLRQATNALIETPGGVHYIW